MTIFLTVTCLSLRFAAAARTFSNDAHHGPRFGVRITQHAPMPVEARRNSGGSGPDRARTCSPSSPGGASPGEVVFTQAGSSALRPAQPVLI